MNTVIERNVEKLKRIQDETIQEEVTDNPTEVASLERLKYRLSDAIREGSQVAPQAFNWTGPDDSMCALSAAVVAARSRGYLE